MQEKKKKGLKNLLGFGKGRKSCCCDLVIEPLETPEKGSMTDKDENKKNQDNQE
ncbi:MAG TPA: hypothetical protein GX711_02360 [Clostridia bacterium]|nr:hypothetical protein [Clostridia bacterium]